MKRYHTVFCTNIIAMSAPIALLFHNPRCSKSRQALALLTDQGCQPEIVEYVKNPPSVELLSQVISALGISAQQLVRTKEARAIGIDPKEHTESQLINIMSDNPLLIERPIFLLGDKAVIGRPPENVLELLP